MAIRGHFQLLMAGGGGGGGAASYLDQLAVMPRSAAGLKKLISTATVAIRVRRSSDNTETDIGFSGDALDTAALASFVGANSGYITKLYDQTGSGLHATPPTTAAQPRIVNAGVYDGKLVFAGAQSMVIPGCSVNTSDKFAIYSKMAIPSATAVQIIAELSTNYNSQSGTAMIYHTDTGRLNAGMANTLSFIPGPLSSLEVLSLLMDRSQIGPNLEIQLFQEGAQLSESGSTAVAVSGNFGAFDLYVGARAGNSFYTTMDVSTWVTYIADTAAIRSSIEALL